VNEDDAGRNLLVTLVGTGILVAVLVVVALVVLWVVRAVRRRT
jgi:hypothetical protein